EPPAGGSSFVIRHSTFPEVIRPFWRLPHAGRYWLLVSAALLGLGLYKNINLVTLLAYVLLAVLVLNLLALGRKLRGLKGRRLVGEVVFAGSPCTVEVRLTAPGPNAGRGVLIRDAGEAHALEWFADELGGEERVWHGEVVLPRRGRYAWGPVVAQTGY